MTSADKDIFSDPSYIVLNVPSPLAEQVRAIRALIDPGRAALAIEISLCGSNGRGTISPGQDPEMVFAEMNTVASRFNSFSTAFGEVRRFPDTGIFYYTLKNPEPFAALHEMFAGSRIAFEPTEFPYKPHCTLKLGSRPDFTDEQIIKKLSPPKIDFIIDTMSIYSLNKSTQTPRLLHRTNLANKS